MTKCLSNLIKRICSEQAMLDHGDAWPFKEPVDVRDVPDYYDIIRDPMGNCYSIQDLHFNHILFVFFVSGPSICFSSIN